MPSALDFCVLALATWRLAHFLVVEEGPFGVARWLRERAGIEHDPDSRQPVGYPANTVAQALGCVWCLSFWTAVPMLALWTWGPGLIPVLVLALSGAAVVIEVTVGRLRQ